MVKFVLVGSSFVECLWKFILDDFKVLGEVKWFGVFGLRSYFFFKEMWLNIVIFNFDCVFFYVGGNDIIIIMRLKDVVGWIIVICENFKGFGVKSVFVVEVLMRGNF